MTAPQIVFAGTAGLVAVAICLMVAGVALVAGLGWSLVVAGGCLGVTSVGGAIWLLRDSP